MSSVTINEDGVDTTISVADTTDVTLTLTGTQGPSGTTGADGADGAAGSTGAAGADGLDGSDGAAGATGAAGANGSDGGDGIDILAVTTDATTARTLALTDLSDVILMSNASANTATVPPNTDVAFAIGAQVLVCQYGAGATTIAAGVGVTLRGTLTIAAQYEVVSLVKIATDEWLVVGGG